MSSIGASLFVLQDLDGHKAEIAFEFASLFIQQIKVAEQESTISELKTTVAQQQKQIAVQQATVAQQQKQIEALNATVQKVSDQMALSKPAPTQVVDGVSRPHQRRFYRVR